MTIQRTGGIKWLSSIKWGIWALLGAEEEKAPLVQGLGGEILMLEDHQWSVILERQLEAE